MNYYRNPNPALNDALDQELAGDVPHDRLYDPGRFFLDADMFERDCVFVSRRARTLNWAYQFLRCEAPEGVFNLNELASISLEVVGRDMLRMAAMAETVRESRSGDLDNVEELTDEVTIAAELLARERARAAMWRRMVLGAKTEKGQSIEEATADLANMERDATVYGFAPGTISRVRSEIAAERERRAAEAEQGAAPQEAAA